MTNVNEARYDVSSGGKLFPILVVVTGNVHSPTVRRQVDGTAIAEVDDAHKHRQIANSSSEDAWVR